MFPSASDINQCLRISDRIAWSSGQLWFDNVLLEKTQSVGSMIQAMRREQLKIKHAANMQTHSDIYPMKGQVLEDVMVVLLLPKINDSVPVT